MKLKNYFMKAAMLIMILSVNNTAMAYDTIALPYQLIFHGKIFMRTSSMSEGLSENSGRMLGQIYANIPFFLFSILKDKNNENIYLLNEDNLQDLGIHDEVLAESNRLNDLYQVQNDPNKTKEEFICANTKSETLKQVIGLACPSQQQ